jgi:hypothetical protein
MAVKPLGPELSRVLREKSTFARFFGNSPNPTRQPAVRNGTPRRRYIPSTSPLRVPTCLSPSLTDTPVIYRSLRRAFSRRLRSFGGPTPTACR